MLVFEVEVGKGHVTGLVEFEYPVRPFNHAELAGGFGYVEFSIDIQADVVEMDVVYGADAVSAQHGGMPHMPIDILDDNVMDGLGAWCLFHELVVQPQEGELLHLNVEIAEGKVVDFNAFAETLYFELIWMAIWLS